MRANRTGLAEPSGPGSCFAAYVQRHKLSQVTKIFHLSTTDGRDNTTTSTTFNFFTFNFKLKTPQLIQQSLGIVVHHGRYFSLLDMMLCRIVLSLVLFSWSAQGFFVPGGQHHTPTVLKAAKGFGAKETPTTPKKKKQETSPVPAEPASSSNDSLISNPLTDSFTSQEQTQDLSQGNKLLEEMRRGRAEQRNAELRKVKEVQEVDAMLRESPEAAVIPEKVAQRMGKRLLPFVGIPLIGGMGAFVGFWYMATYRDLEFEPSLVAGTTIGLLVVGLVVSFVSNTYIASKKRI